MYPIRLNAYEIRRDVTQSGSHFFERGTMRFFDSRLCGDGYRAADGSILCVTSERFRGLNGYSAERRYTVRVFKRREDGFLGSNAADGGGFQAFPTARAARREMEALAGLLSI